MEFIKKGLKTLLGGLIKGTTRQGISEQEAQDLGNYLESKGIKNPVRPGYIPEQGGAGNAVRDLLGLSPQDVEPQSTAGRYAQNLIGAGIPAALGGKAALKQAAPRIAAGQAVGTALESAGAPDWAQKLGVLAGEGGKAVYDSRSGKYKKNPNYNPKQEHVKQLYDKALNALDKNQKGSASALKPFLDEVPSLWKTDSDEKAVLKAEKIANTLASNIDGKGNINIHSAYKNLKSLNKQYKSSSEGERGYIERAREGLQRVLEDNSAMNPLFNKLREDANSFYVYKQTNDMINEGLKGLKPGKLNFLRRGFKTLEKVGRAALNPQARDYYNKLGESIIKDKKADAQRYAIAFNNAYEKQLEDESEGFEDIPFEEEGFEDIPFEGNATQPNPQNWQPWNPNESLL